jgi:hypothetical protein
MSRFILQHKLAVLTFSLSLCAILPMTGVVRGQPGGSTKMRPTLPPYVPQGQWRPLDINNISNLGFLQGSLGAGGLSGGGVGGGIGGGINGNGGGIWEEEWVGWEEWEE